MKSGLRLLPVTIFVATLMLTVKVGSIWQTVASAQDGASEIAQQALQAEPLQLAQAPQDQGFGDQDAFDAFADDTPAGFDDVLTTDEDDEFSDIASLTPGELRLLHDLADRRREIEVKEREVAVREDLLRAAEQQLVVKQEQLEQIRDEIRALVSDYDEEKDQEQQRLRQIYSAMKAKNAAAIFNDLDLDTLIGVVRGMSPRRLAPILAAMDPRKAQQLTLELSDREDLPVVPN